MTTGNNALARTCNVIDNFHVNNRFSYCNSVKFEGDKISFLKGYMINRILHMWLFHLKFMKLAKICFINFI